MEENCVVSVVTRILPLSSQSESLSKLLKPSDVGKPIEVFSCLMKDPKTGMRFLFERTFCLTKSKDLGSLKIPGLVPLTNLNSALISCSGQESGRELTLKVPRDIPLEKVPKLHTYLKEHCDKLGIKLHEDSKKIREDEKQKYFIQERTKLVSPLLKFAMQNECLICGIFINTSQNSVVMSHMLSHTRSGTYACQNCGNKSFSTAESLFNHSFEHSYEMNYSCDVCNCKFNRKYFLTTHYEKEHSNCDLKCTSQLSISFVCLVCKAKLTSRKSLRSHKAMHLGRQSYSCVFCSKTFPSSYSLLHYHAHLHLFLSCHKCKQCRKTFSSRHKLKEHEKLHRITSLHVCNFCGKKFNFSGNLNKHLQLHS